MNPTRAVDCDTDAPQVWRTDLECGGKRYSARRRFGADRPESASRDSSLYFRTRYVIMVSLF